ncbi:hypothetical protein [Amycolatopsis sp. WQ 127309]|uniref:hypothetical protein n=1 Tax=Amycolatopsis sp. WQ 127309 TaxID=2932773 RepID=UPI001FF4D98E|nr:hypothetical protein [Amycolatopsis sp. WQ 127309]UOZ06539.1 hypothetical protein MUY22_48430 [Amycolatopsis sp. WQ 127309]
MISHRLWGKHVDEDNLLETHPDLMDPEWRKHAQTDAWLGAKSDRKKFRKQQKRARRNAPSPGRGRRWGLVAFVLILAVTTAVVVALGRRTPTSEAGTPDTPVPTTVNPTSVAQYAPVDLKHAYARTPADAWRKGIDGITVPAPAAMGSFTAPQVGDAYAKVKQAITASRLDPAVLDRHDTAAYLALFAKDAQGAIAKDLGTKPDFSAYVTELADGYHLLDQGPRTFGSMTAKAGAKPGELVVDVKYVTSYAFDNVHPDGLQGPWEIVSFVRSDESYVVRQGKNFAAGSRGLWPGDGGGSFYDSIGCEALKQGYLAPAYANPDQPGLPGDDQDVPGAYDPSLPMPDVHGCKD